MEAKIWLFPQGLLRILSQADSGQNPETVNRQIGFLRARAFLFLTF